jgi:hypothetical protein
MLVGEMLIKQGLNIFEEEGHGADLFKNLIIGKELAGAVEPVTKHQDVRNMGNIFWYIKNSAYYMCKKRALMFPLGYPL